MTYEYRFKYGNKELLLDPKLIYSVVQSSFDPALFFVSQAYSSQGSFGRVTSVRLAIDMNSG